MSEVIEVTIGSDVIATVLPESAVDATTVAALAAEVTRATAAEATKVPTSRLVAGHPLTSDVTIVKADVGLGNVDNTSDVNKPVSTATQTALNGKADLSGPGSTVPRNQLPNISGSFWQQVANQAAMLALTAPDADTALVVFRTDTPGTVWFLNPGLSPATLGNWGSYQDDAAGAAAAAQTAAIAAAAADATTKVASEVTRANGAYVPVAGRPANDLSAFGVYLPEAHGAVGDLATDDTAAVNAAIAAALAAGGAQTGAKVYLSRGYRCNGQMLTTDDGASTYPNMGQLVIEGTGSYANPVGGGGPFPAFAAVGATLDLRYAGGGVNRTVSDGVLNSTTTVTSATANFTSADNDLPITGTGIPAGTIIASVTNSTTVVLSQAATATASGVTVTLTNNNPKIYTRGTGKLTIRGVTITDQGTSSNPYLKTTNTALDIDSTVTFVGNPSKSKTTCDQDAIILGGPNANSGGNDSNAPFQGYGTKIIGAHFHRMRRAVWLRSQANGNIVRGLNIWQSCGSNLTTGAAIELLPGAGNGSVFGNVIADCLIEASYYPYPIKGDFCQGNTIAWNSFYDATGATLSYIYMGSVNAQSNTILCGYGATSTPHVTEAVAGQNTIVNGNATTGTYPAASQFRPPATFFRGLATTVLNTVGSGTPEITLGGGTNIPGVYVLNSGTPAFAAPKGSLCIVKSASVGLTFWIKEFGTSTTGWFAVGAAGRMSPRNVLTKTGAYTLADDDVVIFNSATGAGPTLPTAVGLTGRQYTVKNINATALVIATTSSQTIDGAAPANLAQWGKLVVMSDGANWLTV